MFNFIKEWLVSRTLKKYGKREDKHRQVNCFFGKTSKILIIMPVDKYDFVISLSLIKHLLSGNKEITLLIFDENEHLIPQIGSIRIEKYTQKDRGRFDVPGNDIRLRLGVQVYDAVIDLNRETDLFCSLCANLVFTDLIVGFDKSDADKFYNFLFIGTENEAEISYNGLLKSLQMF